MLIFCWGDLSRDRFPIKDFGNDGGGTSGMTGWDFGNVTLRGKNSVIPEFFYWESTITHGSPIKKLGDDVFKKQLIITLNYKLKICLSVSYVVNLKVTLTLLQSSIDK